MPIPESMDSDSLLEVVIWLRTWVIDGLNHVEPDDGPVDEVRLSVEFRQACEDGQDGLASSVRDRISVVRVIRSGSGKVMFKEVVVKGSGEVFPIYFKEAKNGDKKLVN